MPLVYTYNSCLEKYGSDYRLKKAVDNKELFKIETGIYADTDLVSNMAIVSLKYPNSVVTMNSAFYFHDLTDVIPKKIYIATKKNARALRDGRIKQIYVENNIFDLGIETMRYRDADIRIYNKERMLIELLRFQNLLPKDYYKEIQSNYRDIVYDLDIQQITELAEQFPKSNMILDTLQREIL